MRDWLEVTYRARRRGTDGLDHGFLFLSTFVGRALEKGMEQVRNCAILQETRSKSHGGQGGDE